MAWCGPRYEEALATIRKHENTDSIGICPLQSGLMCLHSSQATDFLRLRSSLNHASFKGSIMLLAFNYDHQ